jgi:hypothetical protein
LVSKEPAELERGETDAKIFPVPLGSFETLLQYTGLGFDIRVSRDLESQRFNCRLQ